MKVIEVNNLTKKYGNKVAVDSINLSIEEGDFYGFIGPNAAGKSTTINAMLNFIFPTKGNIKIFGYDSIKDTKKIKELVGYVPSEVFYDDNMKAGEVLKYTLSYYPKVNESEIEKYAKIFDLDLTKRMGELSLGTKKKVAVIQALIIKPKLLLLDEPTNGLDPIMQSKLFDILKDLRKKGTTIFMSSHALDEVQKYCSKVAVIKEGKIIKEADISDMLFQNSKSVTIKCVDSKEMSENFNDENITNMEIIDETTFSFVHSGDLKILFNKLSTLDVQDIDITNISLEHIFRSLYINDGEVE